MYKIGLLIILFLIYLYLINKFKEGMDENKSIDIMPPLTIPTSQNTLTNFPELDDKIISSYKEFNKNTNGLSLDKINSNIKLNYLTSFDILFQKYESNPDQLKILAASPLALAFKKDATNDENLENIVKVIVEYIKKTENK